MADETAAPVPEETQANGAEVGSSATFSLDADPCQQCGNGDTTSHHCSPSDPTATQCNPSDLSTPHCTPHCDTSGSLATPDCDTSQPLEKLCDLDHLSCDPGLLTAEGSTSAGRVASGQGGEGDRGGGKKLQKADSGIEVEKSPSVSVREVLSDADGGDSISECCVDSTGLSHSESFRSDDSHGQPEDEMGIDTFILDGAIGIDSTVLDGNRGIESSAPDSSLLTAYVSPTELMAATRDQEGEAPPMEGTKDGPADVHVGEDGQQISGEEDEEETSTDADTTLGEIQYMMNSQVDDVEEDAMKTTDRCVHDKSEEEEEVNQHPWPKHKWRVVPDVRAREIGVTGCTPPSLFREKVQGSLYMVERLKLQYRMEHHEGCVNSLHFNRIGTLLASGADDLQIVLWNWVRNRKALVYESGHRSNVFQAKFMPYSGDCHVVSCARDGQVRLSELSLTGVCKSTKKLAQHKGAAHKLALEYDSPHVFLSCGEDALTYQIDLREEKPKKLIVTKENDSKVPLYSIHSNPVKPYEFLTSGRDPYVRIYDKRKINENVNNGIVKKYCPQHLDDNSQKTNVTCACYSYNGSEIVGSYNDEDIYVFDNLCCGGTGAIHQYSGHRNNATVKGVSFYGPKSEYVVTGSDCGHLFIWDKETEHIVQFLEADRGGVVNVLEPHPFAPVLATSGLDHDVKIWAPISHDPPRMEDLEMQKRKNRRDRRAEKESAQEPEMIDGQMLWFIMNHFRRSARRRLREGGEDVSSSSNSSDSDDDDDEENDDDDHEGAADRMQCQAS